MALNAVPLFVPDPFRKGHLRQLALSTCAPLFDLVLRTFLLALFYKRTRCRRTHGVIYACLPFLRVMQPSHGP